MADTRIIKQWRGTALEITVIVEPNDQRVSFVGGTDPNKAYFFKELHIIYHAKNTDYHAEEAKVIGDMFLRISENITKTKES